MLSIVLCAFCDISTPTVKKRPVITNPKKEWLNESWEHLQTLIEREFKEMS